MYEWLKKIPWGRVSLATLIYFVIEMVARQIEAFATMKYYLMPEYFGVWSKLMMPTAGPPGVAFYIVSSLLSLLGALAVILFYYWIKEKLPQGAWKKSLSFTALLTVFFFLFSYFPMWMMINLPLALVVAWFITGTIITFLASLVFVRLVK